MKTMQGQLSEELEYLLPKYSYEHLYLPLFACQPSLPESRIAFAHANCRVIRRKIRLIFRYIFFPPGLAYHDALCLSTY
jgi:hypothetical protein